MSSEVLMPALSPTMTEGKLARWIKSEGDEVQAVDDGILAKIVIPEGTDHVAVNTPIAVIAANGEEVQAPVPARPTVPAEPVKEAPAREVRGPAGNGAMPAAQPVQAEPEYAGATVELTV